MPSPGLWVSPLQTEVLPKERKVGNLFELWQSQPKMNLRVIRILVLKPWLQSAAYFLTRSTAWLHTEGQS